MNQLTTIAALPGSGAGCLSALKPEVYSSLPMLPMHSETWKRNSYHGVPRYEFVITNNVNLGRIDEKTFEQIRLSLKGKQRCL